MGCGSSAPPPPPPLPAEPVKVSKLPEVPAKLREYVEAAKARLAEDPPKEVIPCELTGEFHGNSSGNLRGFASADNKRTWYDVRIKQLREFQGNILEHWEQLDADFVMKHAGLAGAAMPPHRQLQAKIQETMGEQARLYQTRLFSFPVADVNKIAEYDEVWPPKRPRELKDVSLQPEEATSMTENYAMGVLHLEALYIFSACLARSVGLLPSKCLQWSVKRPTRMWKKAAASYPEDYARNDFRRSGDVYRTSIAADTLEQIRAMVDVLECLGRDTYDRRHPLEMLGLEETEDHYVVERIKNRFSKPALGGYMDLIASVRVNGYVCEIQLNLKSLLDFRGDSGRELAKWFQYYSTAGGAQDHPAGRYIGEMKDGKRHGRGTLCYYTDDRYEGEFSEGNKHGLGMYCYANGDRYTGNFKYDRMHGRGKFEGSSGEVYEGEFKDGMRHGVGVYRAADGTVSEGEWWRNKRVTINSV